MLQKHRAISEEMNQNPWENAYWFARMLINGDKYGAIGRQSKFLTEVCIAYSKLLKGQLRAKILSLSYLKILFKIYSKKGFRGRRPKLNVSNCFLKIYSSS